MTATDCKSVTLRGILGSTPRVPTKQGFIVHRLGFYTVTVERWVRFPLKSPSTEIYIYIEKIMGTLQTSGAISLGNLQTQLGGANPISISEYYRGGAYVPSTRSTVTREPASGYLLNTGQPGYCWYVTASAPNVSSIGSNQVYWGGSGLNYVWAGSGNVASVTVGAYTYYRVDTGGWAYQSGGHGSPGYYLAYLGIYRTSTSTVSINTGVPSSGTISLSQFYGAANP